MKTKHTPGPWEPLRQGIEIQSEEGNHEAHAFVNGIPVPVCEVYANMRCEHDDPIGEYMISKQEGIANLLLIAAAPELLEALMDARNAYQQMFDVMPVAWQTIDNIICDAIAKATGK